MTVCSDMLELILGPINLVNPPKEASVRSVTEEVVDTKEDESNQSDVAIACTAMSYSIEDTKDAKESISTKLKMPVEETKEKGNVNLLTHIVSK